MPGYAPPLGRRLHSAGIVPTPGDRTLTQDARLTALHQAEYLLAYTELCFRAGAYLESQKPFASSTGTNRAARYDAYRLAAALASTTT